VKWFRLIGLLSLSILSGLVSINYFNIVFIRNILGYFEPLAIFLIFFIALIITTGFCRLIVFFAVALYYLSPALLQDSCNFPTPSAPLKSRLSQASIFETVVDSTQILIFKTSGQLNTWEEYTMLRRLALAAYVWPNDSVIFFPRFSSLKLQERLLQKISHARYICASNEFNIFFAPKGN